jgi:two-component system, NarL family, sensor histidine kinase DesK
VTDDGVGLGEDEDVEDCCARGGTGLTGLRERLASAGGSLTADRGPGGGFRITAELPTDTGTDADTGVGAGSGAGVGSGAGAGSGADVGTGAGAVSAAKVAEAVRSCVAPEPPYGARSVVDGPNLGP